MIKKSFIILSLVQLFLVFFIDANIAVQEDYVPRNVDIDRSKIPKNILIGSFVGGRSHLKPMLDIGEILIERGYNVILLTAGNYTPASEYPAVKQISLGPQTDFDALTKVNPKLSKNKEFDFNQLTTILEMSLDGYKDGLQIYEKVAKDYNIDLFFCDGLMNDACFDVGQALKKPLVSFSSHISFVTPVKYKSDPLFNCKVTLENESFLERFKCSVMRPLQMFYKTNPYSNKLNDIRKKNGIETGRASLGRLPKTTLAFIDNFFGFEYPQPLPPYVQDVGPVLSDKYPPLTPELTDFMNKHERVLYVAFGTRASTTLDNINKMLQSYIEAIDKNLIDGVIWALSKTSKKDFPSTLTLRNGTQIQTLPILNNEHPHINIAKFAPQFTILNHTNTKLFLSHAGAVSAYESMYTGVPMLVIPYGGDQMGNAERLETAGIALSLSKTNLNVDDMLNGMEILLKDENVKKNLKRLEVLTKINSKRKYRAADLMEYVLHSNSFNEGERINEEFLKEFIPADTRMGFIRGNNLDIYGFLLSTILGFIGVILWVTWFIVKKTSSISLKSKRE